MGYSKERREYPRLRVDIPCNIYLNNREYVGVMQDISEQGICIVIDEDIDELCVGSRISFQFLDKLGNAVVEEVFGGVAFVNRVSLTADNKTILGANVHNRSFYEYVGQKRVDVFLKRERGAIITSGISIKRSKREQNGG